MCVGVCEGLEPSAVPPAPGGGPSEEAPGPLRGGGLSSAEERVEGG